MSVYSGFSTRAQETHYYKLTEKLIDLLQSKLLFFIKGYNLHDDTWGRQFYAVYRDMAKLELQKYLAPRFSDSCRNLATFVRKTHNRALEAIEVPDFSIDKYLSRLSNTEKHYKMTPSHDISPKIREPKKSKYVSRSPPSHKFQKRNIQSHYYGSLMDSFLKENSRFVHRPRFTSKKKYLPPNYRVSPERSEDRDFWLIDDKIHLFDT